MTKIASWLQMDSSFNNSWKIDGGAFELAIEYGMKLG